MTLADTLRLMINGRDLSEEEIIELLQLQVRIIKAYESLFSAWRIRYYRNGGHAEKGHDCTAGMDTFNTCVLLTT